MSGPIFGFSLLYISGPFVTSGSNVLSFCSNFLTPQKKEKKYTTPTFLWLWKQPVIPIGHVGATGMTNHFSYPGQNGYQNRPNPPWTCLWSDVWSVCMHKRQSLWSLKYSSRVCQVICLYVYILTPTYFRCIKVNPPQSVVLKSLCFLSFLFPAWLPAAPVITPSTFLGPS